MIRGSFSISVSVIDASWLTYSGLSEASPAAQDEDQLAAAAPRQTLPGLGLAIAGDLETATRALEAPVKLQRDRMMSVHDPETRHGHKSSRRRFDGHKAAIVVDTYSQLITAVEVLPGNAPDNLGPPDSRHGGGVRPGPPPTLANA